MALPLYRCGHDHDSFRHRFPAPVRLGLIKSGSLTNREIEKLDAFLLSDGGLENAMDVSTLDGFLCAVPIDDRNWSPLRPMLCDCFKSQATMCSNCSYLQNLFCTNCFIPRFDLGLVVRGLTAPCVLWRVIVDDHSAIALHRSLRPCARKLDQGLFVFFGFGLIGPTHGFLGILPELIGL